MGHPDNEVTLNTVDCPRCGCWLKTLFEGGCGQVHSDYCVNCGRFTSLPRAEHTEKCLGDRQCTFGPVMHVHDRAAKIKALEEDFAKAVKRERNPGDQHGPS